MSEETASKSESKEETKKKLTEEQIKLLEKKAKSQLRTLKVGIIGAGKLSYAICCAILEFTNIEPKSICISAKSDTNLKKFKEKGCEVTKRNYDVFTRFDCNVVFLCFPSSVIRQCYRLGDTKPFPLTVDYIPKPNHKLTILSVVTGVTLQQILDCLISADQFEYFTLEVHRIVLNTSVKYGPNASVCAIDVLEEKLDPLVQELLSSISTVETIPDSQMDSLCLFSTTGLLLSHCFSTGLINAAFNVGHNSPWFLKMPAYSMLTAAQSVLISEKSPIELIEEMTSVSTNCFDGLQVLEDFKLDSILEMAFDAICLRIQNSVDTNDINF